MLTLDLDKLQKSIKDFDETEMNNRLNYYYKDSSEFLIETFFSEMINLNKIFEYDQMVSNPRLLEINQSHKFYLKSLVQNLNNKIESKKNKSVKKTKIKDSIDELKDGIIIYNAGLLLFWPFLNTLFIKLNLLNLRKDNYKDEISKDKAIMATDYIVNGLDSKEKDFIFNKIQSTINQIYFIGGSSRAIILKDFKSHDIDIVVPKITNDTIKLLKKDFKISLNNFFEYLDLRSPPKVHTVHRFFFK
mgnify:CR=1 FL=1